MAAATCDGRKAVALANAKVESESADAVAQSRAVLAIQCDAYEIMARVGTVGAAIEQVRESRDRTRDLAARAVDAVKTQPVASSRLPLSTSHQQMYAVAAEAELASGGVALQAWPTDPWRPVQPLDTDARAVHSGLATALMRGERRAVAFNVRSLTSTSRSVQLSTELQGVPANALRIYRVNWTGDEFSNWSAAELQLIGDASRPVSVALLPGVTQQIWIELAPDRASEPGRFVG